MIWLLTALGWGRTALGALLRFASQPPGGDQRATAAGPRHGRGHTGIRSPHGGGL